MSTSVAVISTDRTFEQGSTDSRNTKKISINVRKERVSTVISETAKFVGDLTLAEGIKLDGHIQGTLNFGQEDGLCIISKSATLEGDMHGPRALIMGTVEGDVFIHGLLMLSPSAIILGNVHYERLIVHDGAQIAGGMHTMRSRALSAPAKNDSESSDDQPTVVRQFKAA